MLQVSCEEEEKFEQGARFLWLPGAICSSFLFSPSVARLIENHSHIDGRKQIKKSTTILLLDSHLLYKVITVECHLSLTENYLKGICINKTC